MGDLQVDNLDLAKRDFLDAPGLSQSVDFTRVFAIDNSFFGRR